MKAKEQLQAEIIEKYKKLVDFYELQFNVDLKQRNYGLKLRSELSDLTAELEKEGEGECNTCKDVLRNATEYPCFGCHQDGIFTRWTKRD